VSAGLTRPDCGRRSFWLVQCVSDEPEGQRRARREARVATCVVYRAKNAKTRLEHRAGLLAVRSRPRNRAPPHPRPRARLFSMVNHVERPSCGARGVRTAAGARGAMRGGGSALSRARFRPVAAKRRLRPARLLLALFSGAPLCLDDGSEIRSEARARIVRARSKNRVGRHSDMGYLSEEPRGVRSDGHRTAPLAAHLLTRDRVGVSRRELEER